MCITCSDAADALVVRSVDAATGLALCVDAAGTESEVESRSSTRPPGAAVLVHAGVAIGMRGMRFVDEFRDAELGRVLAGEILATVEPGRHYKVMEVCGGHTHSIYKYGVDDLLPANVELVHGPGCPVCVIPMGRVDDGIAIAHQPGVIFTCFGDMMRVPGSRGSLLEAKAAGADVRMVYSPLDALRIAQAATPTARSSSSRSGSRPPRRRPRSRSSARRRRGSRTSPACATTCTIVPPLRALLDSPDLRLDGFIGPGHVSHGGGRAAVPASSPPTTASRS